jgi:nucleoid DNA-binding protein
MPGDNISKRDFWHYVNLKVKRVIHHYHVFAVISILFDEMVRDLKDGKEIKVANFGTLMLKQLPPRRYHNVVYKKIMSSPGHRIIRLFLTERLRKKLCSSVDLDKLKANE